MNSIPSQGADTEYLYPINEIVKGKTYGEWIIEYWKAYILKQTSRNKNPEETVLLNSDCYVLDVQDDVVFLPSLYAVHKPSYDCTFTTSNSFFFPLYSEECDYSTLNTNDELVTCVNEHNDYATGRLFINEVEITNLSNYRMTTDFFNITYNELNPYNAPAGTFRALVNGLFIFLKPLNEGDYTLKYAVSEEPPSLNHHYKSEITYHIKVE
jgi:hypothetical protein